MQALSWRSDFRRTSCPSVDLSCSHCPYRLTL
nr:MAG TPA: Serine protease hepsin complex with, scavenger receptor cysteine-rich domain [Inoviridae sp.]